MIFTSSYESVGTVPNDLTLAEFVCSNPFRVPIQRVIIAEGEGDRRITFGEFVDEIKAVSSGIQHVLPARPAVSSLPSIIAVVSSNTLEYAGLVLGIIGSGNIPALVNPTSTIPEICHAFKLVAPEGLAAVFVSDECRESVLDGIKLCKYQIAPKLFSLDTAPLKTYKPLPLAKLTGPADKTLAALYYSSGTTGLVIHLSPCTFGGTILTRFAQPKGTMLSHRNIIANILQISAATEQFRDPLTKMISFLPMYHICQSISSLSAANPDIKIDGSIMAMLVAPITGTFVVHLAKFDLPLFLSSIQKHRVTNAPIVPPVAVALAKHPLIESYNLSSLKVITIAAAPTKIDLVRQLRKRLNVQVVQGYGMTEASPGTHALEPKDELRDGSVGRLYPDMECKLVDDDGKMVGVDEEGEICLRGPNIFMGYIRNATATATTLLNGWLHTGDVGRVTKDGYYWIVDRKKELIKVRLYVHLFAIVIL